MVYISLSVIILILLSLLFEKEIVIEIGFKYGLFILELIFKYAL